VAVVDRCCNQTELSSSVSEFLVGLLAADSTTRSHLLDSTASPFLPPSGNRARHSVYSMHASSLLVVHFRHCPSRKLLRVLASKFILGFRFCGGNYVEEERGSAAVKAFRNKPEGRVEGGGMNSIILPTPFGRSRHCGLFSL
jgi:hypothetical protein